MGIRRSCAVALAFVALCVTARAQEDQYQRAKAALMQGRTDEARQLYCGLASAAPNYKNARAMCTMLQSKGNSSADYDSFYEMGVKFFNDGNYDEAAEAFQKVRSGAHRDDAKDYLLYRLPQARMKAAEAAAAPASTPPAPPSPPPTPAEPTPTATHALAAKHPAAERKTANAGERSGESVLVDALTEYYVGQFDTAESDLLRYLQQYPASALGQFYLGVCRLTRYYIAPEKTRPPELLAQAKQSFRIAKQSAGFTPPEKYVSPKILQVYAATTP